MTHEERLESGIPYVKAEIEALNKEAALVGSSKIEVLEQLSHKHMISPNSWRQINLKI